MPTVPESAFPFCGGSNSAVSPVFDSQRSVNLYPENGVRGSKSSVALIGTPGLQVLATLATTPVRTLWYGNSKLFAIGGAHVYRINPATGVTEVDFGAMSGATGPAQLVSNGVQLIAIDGAGNLYNIVQTAINAGHLTLINGGALSTLYVLQVEYLDSFFIALTNPGLGAATQINVSAPLDGTTWNALDFVQRTGAPDLVTAVGVINGQIFFFGEQNTEVWYNAGNPLFPFARIQGATLNFGAVPWQSLSPLTGAGSVAWTVKKAGNSLLFMGADERGGLGFFMTQGAGAPARISTPAIEALIASYLDSTNASSFVYEEQNHVFYVTNFPNATNFGNATGATLAYDLTTGEWHERAYLNASSGQLEMARPYCACHVTPASGNSAGSVILVGDYANGNIYSQSLSDTSDGTANIQRMRIAPHVSNSDKQMAYPSLSISADIGTASMVLDYSNDGGRTFLGRNRSIPLAGTAAADGMNYYKISQLGSARDRVFKVTISDSSNPIRLIAAYLNVDGEQPSPGMEP